MIETRMLIQRWWLVSVVFFRFFLLAVWDFFCRIAWPFLMPATRQFLNEFIDASDRIRIEVGAALGTGRCNVLQVGSNDGLTNDPLREFIESDRHVAILIEAVPVIFEKLKNLYSGYKNVHPLNLAITSKHNDVFYVISEQARTELGDGYRGWYSQLGSFKRENIEKHKSGMLNKFIEPQLVTTAHLKDLVRMYGVNKLDLLHIDVEGCDIDVFNTLDLQECLPSAILIEHKHMPFVEKLLFFAKLVSRGYSVKVFHDDAFLKQQENMSIFSM